MLLVMNLLTNLCYQVWDSYTLANPLRDMLMVARACHGGATHAACLSSSRRTRVRSPGMRLGGRVYWPLVRARAQGRRKGGGWRRRSLPGPEHAGQ